MMNNKSSPFSGNTNGSSTGLSPTTNVTAYSPEIVRGPVGQVLKGQPPFGATNYDPFLSSRPPSYESVFPTNGHATSVNAPRPTSSQHAPVSYLTKSSVPDQTAFTRPNAHHGQLSRPVTSAGSAPIGSRPATSTSSGLVASRPGSSSAPGSHLQGLTTDTHFGGTVRLSRYLKITVPKEEMVADQAEIALKQRPSFKACLGMSKRTLVQGELYFSFDTISAAQEAADDVAMFRSGQWTVEFITVNHFSFVSLNQPESIDDLEGQIMIWAEGAEQRILQDGEVIRDYLTFKAEMFGKLLNRVDLADTAIRPSKTNPPGVVARTGVLLEFDSLLAARRFTKTYKETKPEGDLLISTELPGFLRPVSRRGSAVTTNAQHHGVDDGFDARDNRIHIMRILRGQDVRTTVMLRNIPNKMQRHQLKELLDQVVGGLYDFLYLRFDFNNGCNVGYAFINFVRSEDIINFYRAFAGKPWIDYGSHKIAEVSYATCQGREGLIAKFQNSGVMLQWAMYRPMLVYTIYGSVPDGMVSEEEPFPPPDNAVKVMRSMGTIQQVGLYPPHNGNRRGAHHQHHGPYDAGTPRALTFQSQRHGHMWGATSMPRHRGAGGLQYPTQRYTASEHHHHHHGRQQGGHFPATQPFVQPTFAPAAYHHQFAPIAANMQANHWYNNHARRV